MALSGPRTRGEGPERGYPPGLPHHTGELLCGVVERGVREVTVAQLIIELRNLPQDAKVLVLADEDYGGAPSPKFYPLAAEMPYAKGWHPREDGNEFNNTVVLRG